MKISKYGNSEYGNVFENHYHILTLKYGKKKPMSHPIKLTPSALAVRVSTGPRRDIVVA